MGIGVDFGRDLVLGIQNQGIGSRAGGIGWRSYGCFGGFLFRNQERRFGTQKTGHSIGGKLKESDENKGQSEQQQ